MKIGFVSTMDGFPWGGSEELWAATARTALTRGHSVATSTLRWTSPAEAMVDLERRGARVSFRRPVNSRLRRMVGRVRPPLDAIARFGADVVCVSQGGTYDCDDTPGLTRFLQATAVPYVVVCQCASDEWIPSPRRRERVIALFRGAAKVVFVSHDNLRTVTRQLATSLQNAVVLRNPVNLSDVSALAWPRESEPSLACVARLEAGHKGHDVLLEALAAERWRNRAWHLRFYGHGGDEQYLRQLAAHYGLEARVSFPGHVADVRSIWADHHLLVLASRAEGTPLALVEAMLCGRPAVVTDIGGNTEWIEEGHTGFIAEAPTARSLEGALERAWAARQEWSGMGMRAREAALKRVDHDPGGTLLEVLLHAARHGRHAQVP